MIIKQEYQTDRKKYTSVQYKREKKRLSFTGIAMLHKKHRLTHTHADTYGIHTETIKHKKNERSKEYTRQ